MFRRKMHEHHSASLPDHITRAQRRGWGGAAFIARSQGAGGGGGRAPFHGGEKESAAVSRLNSERPWAHVHGTLPIYTTQDRQRVHVDYLSSNGRLHAMHEAAYSKPFSRKSAAFWALPNAWGHHGSHHWAHPRRQWGWPSITRDTGGEGSNIVAMVEWDDGNVGEYSLREHPCAAEGRYAELAAGELCMATLALAHEKHPRGSALGGDFLKPTHPMRAPAGGKQGAGGGRESLGCESREFAQMFVVEAVSAEGLFEWAYSCALDSYLHTSWMTCVSGGPPVISLRHGFLSGLCAVANLARMHTDAPQAAAMMSRGKGRHVASDWDLENFGRVLSCHPNFAVSVDGGEEGRMVETPGVVEEARGGGQGCLSDALPHSEADPDRRCAAVGVRWIRIGIDKWAPHEGARALDSPELAEALARRRELTKQECEAYGIADLRAGDYVRGPDCYYMPDGTSLKEHEGWDDHHDQVRCAGVQEQRPEVVWKGTVVDVRRSTPFQDYRMPEEERHFEADFRKAFRSDCGDLEEEQDYGAEQGGNMMSAVHAADRVGESDDDDDPVEDGLRMLVRELLSLMAAQQRKPELHQVACRLLAALASLPLPDEEESRSRPSPVANEARQSTTMTGNASPVRDSADGAEAAEDNTVGAQSSADAESSSEYESRTRSGARQVTFESGSALDDDRVGREYVSPGILEKGRLVSPSPAAVCVRRTDGGQRGSCLWGWRVQQALPVHFENAIEELWIGAVGSMGEARGFRGGRKQLGGSIRWTLMPLTADQDEYTIPVEVCLETWS